MQPRQGRACAHLGTARLAALSPLTSFAHLGIAPCASFLFLPTRRLLAGLTTSAAKSSEKDAGVKGQLDARLKEIGRKVALGSAVSPLLPAVSVQQLVGQRWGPFEPGCVVAGEHPVCLQVVPSGWLAHNPGTPTVGSAIRGSMAVGTLGALHPPLRARSCSCITPATTHLRIHP